MTRTSLKEDIRAFLKDCDEDLLHRKLQNIKVATNEIDERLVNKDYKELADHILANFDLEYEFFQRFSMKDTQDFILYVHYEQIGEFVRLHDPSENLAYRDIFEMFLGKKMPERKPDVEEGTVRVVSIDEMDRLLGRVPDGNLIKQRCFKTLVGNGTTYLDAGRTIRFIYDHCFYNVYLPKKIAALVNVDTFTDLGLDWFMQGVEFETRLRLPQRHLEINSLVSWYMSDKPPLTMYKEVEKYIQNVIQLDEYLLKFPPEAFATTIFRNAVIYRLGLFAIRVNRPEMDLLNESRSLLVEQTRDEFIEKLTKIYQWVAKAQTKKKRSRKQKHKS